jgi:pyrimidine-specific ribonucleoside hydrolase
VFEDFPMVTMVGLDVTHRVLMRTNDRNRLRDAGGTAATLAADLLDYALERAGSIRGTDGAPIHDASAVIAAVAPELFSGTHHRVVVELAGTHTRGMTVVDERIGGRDGHETSTANALVLRDANEQEVIDAVVDAIIELDRNA